MINNNPPKAVCNTIMHHVVDDEGQPADARLKIERPRGRRRVNFHELDLGLPGLQSYLPERTRCQAGACGDVRRYLNVEDFFKAELIPVEPQGLVKVAAHHAKVYGGVNHLKHDRTPSLKIVMQ